MTRQVRIGQFIETATDYILPIPDEFIGKEIKIERFVEGKEMRMYFTITTKEA